MPNLYEVFDRLKATRREYTVVADAVQRLRDAVRAHQVPAPQDSSLRDYNAAARQLEPTYLVRLWAEFETALRSYRRHVIGNPNENLRASDLIDWAQGIQEGRKVDARTRELVHEVREYRNSLVHERDDMVLAIDIEEARRRLSTYLSKLPDQW
ncbi:hypothetical protein ACYOEI_14735 [Singulisphaera rosea]